QMALKKSEELRVSDIFLNFGNGNKSRIIGHGVGLELNEPPILSSYDHSEVSEGYVIALDMHMLSEGVGVVKLEDMILIKRDRNEILTRTPRRLFEVE
ncbi:MAG: M24 family metallopeptidase, partial [Proteobacteria bacterium]|nr:M24 family metallopeptidase [Pseudomonadota bacterium]